MTGTRIPADRETAASALTWQVSSGSAEDGDGIAVAQLPSGEIAMRDTSDEDGLELRFDRDEWLAFIEGVRAGEFDA